MPAYGITAAGFVPKPFAQILSDIETAQLATMDPAIDLSPTGPQGQQNGIVANALASLWQLIGTAYNSFNRQAAEGAGLDNIGDLTGDPREGGSYTLVTCSLVFTSGAVGNTYAAGTLVANVLGNTSQAFSNKFSLTVTATTMPSVAMQSLVIGATPSVNPGTLTVITNPVGGWVSITNPAAQSQLGSNAELDAAYAARQELELGGEGSCNPPATVAALIALGAAQTPTAIPITCSYIENTSRTNYTPPGSSLVLIPNSYALIVYDGGTGWATGAGQQQIGNTIWANKPAGNTTIGAIAVTVNDALLGDQLVYFSVPTQVPLYWQITIVIRSGFTFTPVSNAVQAALVAASTAATPVNGTPPNGQLAPGADVIGSQLEAVIMGVPGVYDVQVLQFGTSFGSTNTAPIVIAATQIAKVSTGTDGSSNPYFTITNGTGP